MRGFKISSSSWRVMRHAILSGIVFSCTVGFISASFAAYTAFVSVDRASPGSSLSSTSWNRIIDNISDINDRLSAIATSLVSGSVPRWNGTKFTTGSLYDTGTGVGIGTVSPAALLDVNGAVYSRGTPQNHGASRAALGYDTAGGNTQFWSWGPNASTQAGFTFNTRSSDGSVFNTPLVIQSSGNTGIGTTNPTSKLDVESTGSATPIFNFSANSNGTSYVWGQIVNTGGSAELGVNNSLGSLITNGLAYSTVLGTQNSTALQFATNNIGRMTIDPTGNVGIGTINPTWKLEVYNTGNAIFGSSSTGHGIYGASTSGYGVYCGASYCGGASAWLNNSDVRLKKEIQPIDHALEKILQLVGVSYHWRDNGRDSREGEKIGLIAQEVEKVFPEVVKTDTSSESVLPGGTKNLSYAELVAPIIQAIKELYSKWIADHEEIETLKKQLKDQQAQIQELKKDIKNSFDK